MTEDLKHSILLHSGILGLFALCVAIALGLVNALTRDAIAQQQLEAERRALREVFPDSLHDNDLLNGSFAIIADDSVFTDTSLLGLRTPRSAYRGMRDGQVSGVILPATAADGYSGAISLLVGIDAGGHITGVRVVSHRETPGLGDKIDIRVSDWIKSFDQHSLDSPAPAGWKVRKDGGDFDQFTGATITPRAVVASVYNTLVFFRQNREALLTP